MDREEVVNCFTPGTREVFSKNVTSVQRPGRRNEAGGKINGFQGGTNKPALFFNTFILFMNGMLFCSFSFLLLLFFFLKKSRAS